MEGLTRFVLQRRWFVLAAWLVVLAVSGVAASGLSDLLTNRFTLPGTDTARAERILEDHFGQKSVGAFTVVARVRGDRQAALREVAAQARAATALLPTGRVVGTQPVGTDLVTAQIVSELEPADAKRRVGQMRAAMTGATASSGAALGETILTGQAAVEHDLDPVFNDDLKTGELFIAIPAALLILAFVFGTLAFLVPFLFAAFAIPVTLGIVWIFANAMQLTTYLQNMVMLIGLGIAIDYSLLVVHRYREELGAGRTKEDAIVRTMSTAGRTVVFSGTAVAIGLAMLLFMPLPFMRGFGLGGLFIPVVSVACALTLLPLLLLWLAEPLDRVRFVPKRLLDGRDDVSNGFWGRLAHWIMRRPATIAAVTGGLLVLATLPVLALQLGPGSNEGIPQRLEAIRGLNLLSAELGEGATAPDRDRGRHRWRRPRRLTGGTGGRTSARVGAAGRSAGRRGRARTRCAVPRPDRPLPAPPDLGAERVRQARVDGLRRGDCGTTSCRPPGFPRACTCTRAAGRRVGSTSST